VDGPIAAAGGRSACAAALLLALGCAAAPQLAWNGPPGPGEGSLLIEPQVNSGRWATQAVVAPWTLASVDHVRIQPYYLDGSTETPVTSGGGPLFKQVARADLAQPLRFLHLRIHTTYRIRGFAYSAAAEAPASLISKDSQSFLDIVVDNVDQAVAATLSIQLADVPFSGQATASGIAVTAGSVTDAASESLLLGYRTAWRAP